MLLLNSAGENCVVDDILPNISTSIDQLNRDSPLHIGSYCTFWVLFAFCLFFSQSFSWFGLVIKKKLIRRNYRYKQSYSVLHLVTVLDETDWVLVLVGTVAGLCAFKGFFNMYFLS